MVVHAHGRTVELEDPLQFRLGVRVSITDGDCTGRIVDHTRYLDGSERFGVEYWHNGERKFVNCRADELEAVE